MKVLVTGREGQLARGLVEAAAAPVFRWWRSAARNSTLPTRSRWPRRSHASVRTLSSMPPPIRRSTRPKPSPPLAHAVNALGAEHVAKACAARAIPIIHISTDYVFDGTKHGPYVEDDPTAPINVYGRTKLEGEQRVANACERHLILRTAWVHSPWGVNFVKTMLRLATTRPNIGVVDDQLGSPTYAPHLAEDRAGDRCPRRSRSGRHALGHLSCRRRRRDHLVWFCPGGFSARGGAGAAGGRGRLRLRRRTIRPRRAGRPIRV